MLVLQTSIGGRAFPAFIEIINSFLNGQPAMILLIINYHQQVPGVNANVETVICISVPSREDALFSDLKSMP